MGERWLSVTGKVRKPPLSIVGIHTIPPTIKLGIADACQPYRRKKTGASGEIRTLKHLFLRQAAIPIRARWHMVHRGGFEPPRPTRGDRVTAGPFRPGSRTCANLAEGRRIERPSLITMPRFSGPVADHSAGPSAWRRVRELNPLASCERPCLADKCLTVRPTLR